MRVIYFARATVEQEEERTDMNDENANEEMTPFKLDPAPRAKHFRLRILVIDLYRSSATNEQVIL